MSRITNATKDAIVKNALLKSGATARIEAVKQKRFDWAERARVESIGGPEKAAEYARINTQARKTWEGLPKGLQDNSNIVEYRGTLYLNLAGVSVNVSLRGFSEASNKREVITADSPLCQEFYDIEAEDKAAKEYKVSVESQVRATLNRFGTVKRLLQEWPEVVELIPAEAVAPKSNLPAIQVADLNKLVGLK